MSKDLTYYRFDIENWLDENDKYFGWADTPEEYAENAVRYHNQKRCKNRCQCIDDNLEYVTPKLSPEDQQWFREIAKKRNGVNWGM